LIGVAYFGSYSFGGSVFLNKGLSSALAKGLEIGFAANKLGLASGFGSSCTF
jgi:hypothetical protein